MIKLFKLSKRVWRGFLALRFYSVLHLHPRQCFDQRKPADGTRQLSTSSRVQSLWNRFKVVTFFVTNLLFPLGYCHCFFWKFQCVTVTWMQMSARSLHPSVSHFSHCLKNFLKRPSRGETRKTRLSPWFTGTSFSGMSLTEKRSKLGKADLNSGGRMLNDQSHSKKKVNYIVNSTDSDALFAKSLLWDEILCKSLESSEVWVNIFFKNALASLSKYWNDHKSFAYNGCKHNKLMCAVLIISCQSRTHKKLIDVINNPKWRVCLVKKLSRSKIAEMKVISTTSSFISFPLDQCCVCFSNVYWLQQNLIRPHGEQLTLTETFTGTIKEALSDS